MPAQQKQGGLMAKYGAKLDKATRSHADDETTYGRVDLPGGIKNGVAKLTKCYFKQYESGDYAGEYFFRAEGVVVEPTEVPVEGGRPMRVAGMVTSIMIPVHDRKKSDGMTKTQEEFVEEILNEMRKLGIDTSGKGGNDLEAMAAALEQAGPYFRFRTSVGKATQAYPNPRVFENWDGDKGLEDYTPPEEEDVDERPRRNGTGGGATGASTAGDYDDTHDGFADTATNTDTANPSEDLDELARMADQDDADAQDRLETLAKKAGATDKQVKDAKTWAELVGLIRGAEEGNAGGSADPVPKAGNVVFYRVKDGKKVVKRECDILKVDAKAKTVDLKDLSNPRQKYQAVPWDQLIWE